MIHLIVAAAENNVIGQNGHLPWHLPDDLKFFKETTMGHVILMGRKTYESIGRPLPGRTNVVLTRNPYWQAPGIEVVNSLKEAVDKYADKELFITGGAELFALAIDQNLIQSIYLTRVHTQAEGDTILPPLPQGFHRQWHRHHPADAKHLYDFTFEHWIQ